VRAFLLVLWYGYYQDFDMPRAIAMVREMRDPRGINEEQEQFLIDYELNWQTWIQNNTVADEWLEEMA
jgi:hypothetical protein